MLANGLLTCTHVSRGCNLFRMPSKHFWGRNVRHIQCLDVLSLAGCGVYDTIISMINWCYHQAVTVELFWTRLYLYHQNLSHISTTRTKMTKTEIRTSKNSPRASRHSKIYARKNITPFSKSVDKLSTSSVRTGSCKLSQQICHKCDGNNNWWRLVGILSTSCGVFTYVNRLLRHFQ